MKYSILKYTNTNNIGDEIQTLAAEQHLPRVDASFDRDKLAIEEAKERHIMIMNGWYCVTPKLAFPPADFIDPIMTSIHINRRVKDHFLSEKSLAYFKQHEPIGCRDTETMRMLKENGVKAYFSKCLTITFPKRTSTPKVPKVFLVDVPSHVVNLIPQQLGSREYISHDTNEYGDLKLEIARKLLSKYKDEATLVITSRLHCALPCTAMGIPVILWANPNSTRLEVAKSLGIKIYNDKPFFNLSVKLFGRLSNFPPTNYLIKKIDKIAFKLKYTFFTKVNWDPKTVDIEDHKKTLKDQIQEMLKNKESK